MISVQRDGQNATVCVHWHHTGNHIVVRLPVLAALDIYRAFQALWQREHVLCLQFDPIGGSFLSGLGTSFGQTSGGGCDIVVALAVLLGAVGGDGVMIVCSVVRPCVAVCIGRNDVTVLIVMTALLVQVWRVCTGVEGAIVGALCSTVTMAVVSVSVASVRIVVLVTVVRVVIIIMMSPVPLVRVMRVAVLPAVSLSVSLTALMGHIVVCAAAVMAVRMVIIIHHRLILSNEHARSGAFVLASLTGRGGAHRAVGLANLTAVVLRAAEALLVSCRQAALRHRLLLLNDDLLRALRHPLEVLAVVLFTLEADVPTIPYDQQAIVRYAHLVKRRQYVCKEVGHFIHVSVDSYIGNITRNDKCADNKR